MEYKLVKCYPGSPRLGTIATLSKNKPERYILDDSFHQAKPANVIEKHSEYWEKVKDKEYEVLSFGFTYPDGTKGFSRVLKDGQYHMKTIDLKRTLKELIYSKGYYIKDVKRLSDGKIFTVGNICKKPKHNTNSFFNEKQTIKKFNIKDDQLRITFKENLITDLDNLELWHKYIFKTEDGVEIFEGGKYWFINKNLNFSPKSGACYVNDSDVIYFSTKEKAEEYIMLNKPFLSFKEITDKVMMSSNTYNALHDLVKNKLKLDEY